MTEEQINLLKQFDAPYDVGLACWQVYEQTKHFAVPGVVKAAVNDGLLIACDGQPVVDSDKIYFRAFVLTDAGRLACGLKVVEPVVAKPVVSKSVQKRVKTQSTGSLFD